MAKRTYDEEVSAPATSDAYTGMLGISLLALIGGCVLLYLDYSQYPSKEAPRVERTAPQAPAPAPPQNGGIQPPPSPDGKTPMPPEQPPKM